MLNWLWYLKIEGLLEKEGLDFLELVLKVYELFVIILSNGRHLFSNIAELAYLIFNFVLELANFIFKIINTEFFQHDNIMIPVLP